MFFNKISKKCYKELLCKTVVCVVEGEKMYVWIEKYSVWMSAPLLQEPN